MPQVAAGGPLTQGLWLAGRARGRQKSGMSLPDLSRFAVPGTEIHLRVTPRGGRDAIEDTPEGLRVRVSAPPEDGKATAAVRRLLAKAMGVAPSRLELVRGATSREKCFRFDG